MTEEEKEDETEALVMNSVSNRATTSRASGRAVSPQTIGLSVNSLPSSNAVTLSASARTLRAVRAKWCQCTKFHREETKVSPHRWRWVMLCIFSMDICVSYIPYYTFVPIPRQSMQVYGVDEAALNVLCILYALVFVPAAFVTGPIVAAVGCRGTFLLAMTSTTIGCAFRCSPKLVYALTTSWEGLFQALWSSPPSAAPSVMLHADSAGDTPSTVLTSFWWLVFGQALCAIGQPLLVNTTSEMGAEWFPPHERPTAAMVSNLMNFVGSSLSFILPPLFVGESQKGMELVENEMGTLLRMQLWVSMFALIVTAVAYQPAPARPVPVARLPATCIADIRAVIRCADFWFVNGYFAIYISICHAFDAVEGSLLEHYGYSASLTSWTAVSCGIASVVSTLVEARYITSATAYRGALVAAGGFLAVSQFLGFFCLLFRMHGMVFVFAVGIMGLATPGWGCSCELGAEVCYPAREATVSSILEAFSNMGGVLGIIGVQYMLDSGYGAAVLGLLGAAAMVSCVMLLFLSGRLRRTECEGSGYGSDQNEESKVTLTLEAVPDMSPVAAWKGTRRSRWLVVFSVFIFFVFCRVLLLLPRYPMAEDKPAGPTDASALDQAQQGVSIAQEQTGPLLPRIPKTWAQLPQLSKQNVSATANIVISCSHQKQNTLAQRRLKRFVKRSESLGLTFEVFPCVRGSPKEVLEAIFEGLISKGAQHATQGVTATGSDRVADMGKAITHLRLMKKITRGNATLVNVFEDVEVLLPRFQERRNELLTHFPDNLDMVKLNVKRPAGKRVKMSKAGKWMHRNVFRMMSSLSPTLNTGLSNYVISKTGAAKVLKWSKGFSSFGRWESLDQYLLSTFYKESNRKGSWMGFTVTPQVLSVTCKVQHQPYKDPLQAEWCK